MVRGESWVRPQRPSPQQLAAHAVELREPAPTGSCAGRSPGWMAPCHADRTPTVPPARSCIGVVDAVAGPATAALGSPASVPSVLPWRAAEVKVMVAEFSQSQVRAGSGRSRPALATRRWSSKGCGYGRVCSVAASGAPCFGLGFCSKSHYPSSEEHPLGLHGAVPKAVLRSNVGLNAHVSPSTPGSLDASGVHPQRSRSM